MPLKVMTILGTRPEIIRLSRVITRLEEACEHVLIHTGQNYDFELNEIFFSDLGLRQPDRFLDAAGGSLGDTLANILRGTESAIRDFAPDAVLVLGDTNSAISAIIARRMKIPVYHMEAGNRSFDRNVPEELNRKIVDHIADFNLVYTEHSRRHLLSEGLPHRRIYLTGSPMREVLTHYGDKIKQSSILSRLDLLPKQYFLISLHREENVDNSIRLGSLINALETLAQQYDIPIIVSTHPRTKKRLENLQRENVDARLQFLPPFGFFDYNKLQLDAYCVLSDSGTIAEESSILGFPAITPRDAIERPEALDVGSLIVTGLDTATIVSGVEAITKMFEGFDNPKDIPIAADYCITNTSHRVVNLILGTTKLSNNWDGIRRNDLG